MFFFQNARLDGKRISAPTYVIGSTTTTLRRSTKLVRNAAIGVDIWCLSTMRMKTNSLRITSRLIPTIRSSQSLHGQVRKTPVRPGVYMYIFVLDVMYRKKIDTLNEVFV